MKSRYSNKIKYTSVKYFKPNRFNIHSRKKRNIYSIKRSAKLNPLEIKKYAYYLALLRISRPTAFFLIKKGFDQKSRNIFYDKFDRTTEALFRRMEKCSIK